MGTVASPVFGVVECPPERKAIAKRTTTTTCRTNGTVVPGVDVNTLRKQEIGHYERETLPSRARKRTEVM